MEDSPKDKSLATHPHSEGEVIQGNPKDDPPKKPQGTKDGHYVVNNFLEHSRRELGVLNAEEGKVSDSESNESVSEEKSEENVNHKNLVMAKKKANSLMYMASSCQRHQQQSPERTLDSPEGRIKRKKDALHQNSKKGKGSRETTKVMFINNLLVIS